MSVLSLEAQPSGCPVSDRPSIRPYTGITYRAELAFGKRRYLVIVYAAFDAYGTIGPEINGIAVLDDVHKRVVLDEHCKAQSGYFGPSPAQVQEFQRLTQLSWFEFQEFVNGHPRTRVPIT